MAVAVAVAAGGAGKPHSSTRDPYFCLRRARDLRRVLSSWGIQGRSDPQDVGNAVRSSPCAFYLFIRAHRIGAHGSPLASVSSFFCKGMRTHHQQQTAQAPRSELRSSFFADDSPASSAASDSAAYFVMTIVRLAE